MAGTIKLDGTTFLSKSGSDFTLDVGSDGTISQGTFNGTVGSTATFPAGHIIKSSFIGDSTPASTIGTTSTTFEDTAIEISHVTAMSSADSYLVAEFYSGIANISGNTSNSAIDITMRTVSNSTYTAGESVGGNSYPAYFYTTGGGDTYYPIYIRFFCGLVSEMDMPATKSSWAAGDTLYFRLFFKTGSRTFNICVSNSIWNFSIKEVVR